MNEQDPRTSGARDLSTISPGEREQYYAVPGWGIISQGIFMSHAHHAAAEQVAGDPSTLIFREETRGYWLIDDRFINEPGKPKFPRFSNSTDMPTYYLDPLSEEEVKQIEEAGEIVGRYGVTYSRDELIRPDDLRRILEPDTFPRE